MSSNSDSPLPLRSRQLIAETPIKLIWEDRESTSPVKASKNKKKSIQWTEIEPPKIDPFSLPKKYIQYADEYNIIEYELDKEDEQFLKEHSKYIDADLLEFALDYLEKESFISKEYSSFTANPDSNITDQPLVCSVCCLKNILVEGDNPLMQCKGCDIYSHASCQGLATVEENWFCERCDYERNNSRLTATVKKRCLASMKGSKCSICNEVGGSMMYRDDEWVHNICLLFLAGFSFNEEESNIKKTPKQKCVFCKEGESLINCSNPTCKLYYHGLCAQRNGCYFNSFQFIDNTIGSKPMSYCPAHSVRREQQILEKLLPEGHATVLVGNFLNSTTRVTIENLVEKPISEKVFNLIWNYWLKKRLNTDYGRKPLIPRLVIEKSILRALTVKNEESKLHEARLRWEEIKEKLVPHKISQLDRMKFQEAQLSKIPKRTTRQERLIHNIKIQCEDGSEEELTNKKKGRKAQNKNNNNNNNNNNSKGVKIKNNNYNYKYNHNNYYYEEDSNEEKVDMKRCNEIARLPRLNENVRKKKKLS